MRFTYACLFPLCLAVSNCSDQIDPAAEIDEQLLAEYRTAIPTEEQLSVGAPTPAPNALTLVGDAELARLSAQVAISVNLPVAILVRVLGAIVETPPTLYNSDSQEFLWGPFPNDDDFGNIAVYIRRNAPSDDFQYDYAFVRLAGRDVATATAIIQGGGTPATDADGEGVGITLWDFEANNAFNEEHDPDYDPAAVRTEGRFTTLFGRGENTEGAFRFNVAVFRNFQPDDATAEAEPFDANYFYGRFTGNDGNSIDFVNFEAEQDFCDTVPDSCFDSNLTADAAETLNVYSAFFNRGVGRGEAEVSSGDLTQTIAVSECWDILHDRVAISVAVDDQALVTEGQCSEPFVATLAELGLPALDDIDPAALDQLGCIAENGPVDACN